MIKRLLIFSFAFFAISNTCWGQFDSEEAPSEMRAQLESAYIAFITTELQLTPEESQRFWPVYNEYKDKRRAIKQNHRALKGKVDLMSDAELENYLTANFDHEQDQLDLKRDYFNKLRGVLPIRKIAKLNQAENKFKRRVLEMIKNRRNNRRGNFRDN